MEFIKLTKIFKDYKNAFKFLKKGNELLKIETKYDFSNDEKKFKVISIFIKKLKNSNLWNSQGLNIYCRYATLRFFIS